MDTYLKALCRDNVTQNWDVVVTYDENSINDLLLKNYNEPNTGIATTMEPSFETSDRDDVKYTQYYSFNLGPPLIQFRDTPNEPTCDLTMPILSGSIWSVDIEDGKVHPTTNIESGQYSIVITQISLGMISGETEDGHIKHGNDIVEFPVAEVSDEQIIINFPASEFANYSITYPKDVPESDIPFAMRQDSLLTALRNYFSEKVDAIHYALAGVNNRPPASGVVDMIPKAFRIVTYKDDNGAGTTTTSLSKSYLSILIQTRGSDILGNTKQLQSTWNAEWAAAGVNPTPEGKSASIILNNAYFITSFVKPALLRDNQVTSLDVNPLSADDMGLQLKCQWRTLQIPSNHYEDTNITFDKKLSKADVPALEVNPNDSTGLPLRITFGQAKGTNSPATISLEWKYSYRQTWTGTMSHLQAAGHGIGVVTINDPVKGGFTATFTLNKVFDITDLTQEDLGITIGFNKDDWTIDVKPDEGGSWWQIFGTAFGGTEQVGFLPNFVKDSAVEGIGFTFNFDKLRFFSITNVLLPGRKVINVDVETGLRIPRDVVIVGDVVQST